MPSIDLDGPVHECWQRTKDVIQEGVRFNVKKRKDGSIRVENNLPGSKDNPVAHVRPHANKAAYRFADGTESGDVQKNAYPLPDGRMMTKQSFWLNNTYVYSALLHYNANGLDES